MGHPKIRSPTSCSGDSQGVQLVDGLVLVGPLQVHLDLPDQREAVRVRNVQLLHLVYAVFLSRHTGADVNWFRKLTAKSEALIGFSTSAKSFFENAAVNAELLKPHGPLTVMNSIGKSSKKDDASGSLTVEDHSQQLSSPPMTSLVEEQLSDRTKDKTRPLLLLLGLLFKQS